MVWEDHPKDAIPRGVICPTTNQIMLRIFLNGFRSRRFRAWSRMRTGVRLFAVKLEGFPFREKLTVSRGGMRTSMAATMLS